MKTSLVTTLITMTAAISILHATALPSGQAETLYVSSGGIDVHTQAPYVFPGIQAAVDAADPGDRVVVPSGTYTENVTIDKTLTLESPSGPHVTTVIAADPGKSVFTINAEKVTLSGFTAYGATSWSGASGVYLSPESGKCTITNNRFGVSPTKQNGSGISLYESNGNTISQNDCRFNQYDGINATRSNDNILKNNSCSYNDDGGISFLDSHGNLLEGNESKYSAKSGITLFDSSDNIVIGNDSKYNLSGISLNGSASNPTSKNLLIQNVVYNNDSNGIYIVDGTDNRLIMNTIQLNGGTGIHVNQVSGNRCWLNNLLSNSSREVRTGGSTNQWACPTLVWYTYSGGARVHLLGNYYGDHDLSDSNGDGVTDTAYDHLSDGDPSYDWFPLANPSTHPAWGWDVLSESDKTISAGSDLRVLSKLTIGFGTINISGGLLTIGV